MPRPPKIPLAPRAIQKGVPLTSLLDCEAIECMALNVQYAHPAFDTDGFIATAMSGLESLKVMERGRHIAEALQQFLPAKYTDAIEVLIGSMAGELTSDEEFGLAPFFYLPYSFFIADFGENKKYNGGKDPFYISMNAMHELTRRFTAEFAIRPFLINQQERTLAQTMNGRLTEIVTCAVSALKGHGRNYHGDAPQVVYRRSIACIADP